MRQVRLLLIVFLMVGLASFLTAQSWYNPGWNYRVKLTVDNSMVSGSNNLSSFPFLVNIINPGFQAGAQTDGDDILFTSGDGTTKLDHEIEVYDASTGGLVAWVRIPSLSYSSDTDLYVYYGNPTASNQQNANSVWDSNYKGVWHMTGGTGTTLFESTSNPNNGTKGATGEPANSSAGKIGGAQNFDGSNDFVNCGSDSSLDNVTTRTIEFWTRLDTLYPGGIQGSHLLNKGGTPYWFVSTDNTGEGRNIYAAGFSTSNGRWWFPKFNTGVWYYVVITHNASSASNDPVIYMNGVSQTVTEYSTPGGSPTSDATQDLQFSKDPSNPRWVDGLMDEIRVSNVIRTSDWIITQYRNQNSSSYLTVAQDETLPVELSSFTATITSQYFVQLHWVTQSETDALGYIIFRSLENDLESAIQASPLIDATNTATQVTYEFTDTEVTPGTWYYWLQSLDLNGNFNFHGPVLATVTSEQGGDAPGIPTYTGISNVYPNPFNPNLNIQYSLKDAQDVSILIYNTRGQMVQSFELGNREAGVHNLSWDANGQATGIYLIRMQAGNKFYNSKAVLSK